MAQNKSNGKANGTGDTLAQVISGFVGNVTAIATLLLLFVFPLYITSENYSNILRAKYKFFWLMVVVLAAVCLLAGLAWLFIDRMEYGGAGMKKFFSRMKPSNWKAVFPVSERGLLTFIVIALLSTLTSEYLYESFWGNEGRYSGFFLLLLYVVMYFLLSRFLRFRQWYLDAFLLSSSLAGLFGITDYFRMDIMGYKVGVPQITADIFTSTFGNINTFTAFLGMALAVAAALFAVEKNGKRALWYFLHLAIASAALITSQSDNGYLAVAALFISLPFFLFKTRMGLRRYLVILAVFFSAAAWVGWVNVAMEETVIGLSGIGGVVTTLPGLPVLAAALWLAAVALFVLDRKREKAGKNGDGDGLSDDPLSPLPRRIWMWAMIAAVLAVAVMFVDANFLGHGERYGALGQFLVFDDDWGTQRGFVWRIAFEDYRNKFTPLQRVLGYGPDTFGIITTKFNKMEMHYATGQIYDSAHNAYIHYFATIGPIGLAGYLVFLIGSLKRFASAVKEKPVTLAVFAAVLCYSAQALVNIDLPIVTPFLWGFLAVGAARIRAN
ncbi:hypothetical protein B5E84_04945 [Lachnoclostridium sp. An14]|uniref:O-antigen ligase family protein n=1 Tax=Lachnoclostridium sp. An14 TaxID=1965562 RepID=UPI000B3ABE52|nr:O-antigen ligase family protein [Lachnoclostridium sp. An14]OUQ20084.1 hypothetical protein B5E84_04945 [Lachnoclostridium sp. An14]